MSLAVGHRRVAAGNESFGARAEYAHAPHVVVDKSHPFLRYFGIFAPEAARHVHLDFHYLGVVELVVLERFVAEIAVEVFQ